MRKNIEEIKIRLAKLATKPVENEKLIKKWKRILKNEMDKRSEYPY